MKEKFLKTLREYGMLSQGDSVVVALSGGKDSVALLHLLCSVREEYSLRLLAVHVNHSIRGEEAARDAAFAETLCRLWGVDFNCVQVDVPALAKERGLSLEACGREVRYEVFSHFGTDKIATAHTASDSVETLLLNLTRGSGAKGLCGIPACRDNIIRPLITCYSDEVLEYLRIHELPFVEDSTNQEPAFARNFVRTGVIPLLRQLNPAFEQNALHCASVVKEQHDFIVSEAAHALEESAHEAKKLSDLPLALRHEALRILCKQSTGAVPEFRHLQAIDVCLKTGSQVQMNGAVFFRVRCGKAEFYRKHATEDYSFSVEPGEYSISIGTLRAERMNCEQFENFKEDTFSFAVDYDKIGTSLICRNKREGDRFYDAKRKVGKSMKKYLNELAFAPEQRGAFPVFTIGGEVVGTLGSTPGAIAPTSKTKTILLITFDRKKEAHDG